jgi:hypothetical protein
VAQEPCMAHVEEQPCVAHVEEWPYVVPVEEWLCVAHMADIAWASAITEAFGTAPGGTTGAVDGGPMA